jgi:membrane-associated phospholipid phosphatase
MRMPEYTSKRSVLVTVLQSFWLFLSILLLCILIFLIYVPGFSVPDVLLSMSPNHNSTNQLGSTFFVLCMVTAITVLHFMESNKAIKLSIILSFLIIIILGYNLCNTSTPVSPYLYGLYFTVTLMIFTDAFIMSEILTTPSDAKRKVPMVSDLSLWMSDYFEKTNIDENLKREITSLEAVLDEM